MFSLESDYIAGVRAFSFWEKYDGSHTVVKPQAG